MEILDAINKVFDVVDKTLDAVDEEGPGGKKVTLGEGIGLAVSAIGLVPAVMSFNTLKADWEARGEKKDQWLAAFKERFDLPNDELELQIEELLDAVAALSGTFVRLKAARVR